MKQLICDNCGHNLLPEYPLVKVDQACNNDDDNASK